MKKTKEMKEDEEDEESVKIIIYLYFIPHTTFSSNFLHAVTFLHILHIDVLRRQIEIETESKNQYNYRYNAGPPMAFPTYTVLPHYVIMIQCLNTMC